MVMGRLKGAVSDVTETIRRLFSDPPCHQLDPSLDAFGVCSLEPIDVSAQGADFLFGAELAPVDLELSPELGCESVLFQPKVQAEGAFAEWAAGARICEMEVFRPASGRRTEVPPLPRRARVCPLPPDGFRPRPWGGLEPLALPRSFQADPGLRDPRVRKDLELALNLPMAVTGEDLQQLPKPLWMRYTLQIVKSTGENIRNLDVLGIYRIPSRGVESLRHDARSDRLVIQLGAAATGARRVPFMLARRKDDRTIVSCYLEGN